MTASGDIPSRRQSIELGNVEKERVHIPSDHIEKVATVQDIDIKFASESKDIFFTEEEATHVKRKIDFFILPLLCGCYIFSVCDFTLSITKLHANNP